MNPREIRVCFKGYQEKIKAQSAMQDNLNHTLGVYIYYAVNNPKKYPKKPFSAGKSESSGGFVGKTDEDVMRYFRQKFGGKQEGK